MDGPWARWSRSVAASTGLASDDRLARTEGRNAFCEGADHSGSGVLVVELQGGAGCTAWGDGAASPARIVAGRSGGTRGSGAAYRCAGAGGCRYRLVSQRQRGGGPYACPERAARGARDGPAVRGWTARAPSMDSEQSVAIGGERRRSRDVLWCRLRRAGLRLLDPSAGVRIR